MLGSVKVLRTPDDRFRRFTWAEPRYLEVPGGDGEARLRVAYVDEGPPQARWC